MTQRQEIILAIIALPFGIALCTYGALSAFNPPVDFAATSAFGWFFVAMGGFCCGLTGFALAELRRA